jgi:hypothetical protein
MFEKTTDIYEQMAMIDKPYTLKEVGTGDY